MVKMVFFGTYLLMIWQSESHYQHQNVSEHIYQKIKRLTNNILDHMGAPAYTWLLDIIYMLLLSNYTYNAGIKKKKPPIQQYLLQTLAHCYIFYFGNYYIKILMTTVYHHISLGNVNSGLILQKGQT